MGRSAQSVAARVCNETAAAIAATDQMRHCVCLSTSPSSIRANRPLATLLQHCTHTAFAARWSQHQPFVVHGSVDALAPLTQLPFLASLDALLNSWPHPVSAHLPDVDDEASAVEVSTVDARKLFTNGMGLLFNEAHELSPVLRAWLGDLRHDLQFSALTQSRCLLYATPAGKGTAPHFDQNFNVVVQLHGTKTWWLAPNHHVNNPLSRHTMGLPMDSELQSYATAPMPTTVPSDGETIVLRPGSVLFVPRGVWHATHGDTEALALNFTYSAPAWLDIFTAALRSRLALSEAWRAAASPLAVADFAQLVDELIGDAQQWSATDILAVTEADDEPAGPLT